MAGAAAALTVALACGGAGGADIDSDGGPGAAGSGNGAGGTSGKTCGTCFGTSYKPCNEDGTPGEPINCEAACVEGVGCAVCSPGTTTCVGNEVHACGADATPGELQETCSAGSVCSEGKCKSACEAIGDQPSNVGCEFWAVDLDQQDGGGNDPASMPWGVVLSNAGDEKANYTIEINEAPVGQPIMTKTVATGTIAANDLVQLKLPTRELDCGVKPNDYASPGTCLSSRAFRITSTAPIVAYQFNVFENAFSNDASLLLPTTSLGLVYRAVGWPAGHPALIELPGLPKILDRAYVTVVGTRPNTKVRVKPAWRIKGNPPIAKTNPGGLIEATLGPFDVLNLETDDATLQEATNPATTDLSGTAVEADQPVAVWSGVESTGAGVPKDAPKAPDWKDGDTCCLDHLEDQMMPMESLGKRYVVTRSPVRSTGGYIEPDIIRFVGAAAKAVVKTNLPAPYDFFTINPGQVLTTWTQTDFVMESDEPLYVGQILVSNQYLGGAYKGDPSLTVFPPAEQARSEYVILTPSGWTESWVVISAEAGSKVVMDGTETSICEVNQAGTLGGKTYESRRCKVKAGVHRLTGDRAFGIVAYGYGNAGSYAFAGGADVKKIYVPPPID